MSCEVSPTKVGILERLEGDSWSLLVGDAVVAGSHEHLRDRVGSMITEVYGGTAPAKLGEYLDTAFSGYSPNESPTHDSTTIIRARLKTLLHHLS